MSPPCPSPETLGRIAQSAPGDSRYRALEAHVEACPECQSALERLAADDLGKDDRGPERRLLREQPPLIPGFVIERELGRGGMGVVYQAWQPQLARRVAIKVVSGGLAIGADDRRRWLREAQAIGQVRHRNVVQLHEAGEQDGCLYLVLGLIAGGSLAERIARPLPVKVAVGLIETVARAVDQIHKAGMLHLDIKPSNILLDGPEAGAWDEVTPMLADFGIARAGDDAGATTTGPTGVRGTPSFMAPEQIGGDRGAIGPRSDVFALGATLYTLLTGRPPFQAASAIETLDLVRTREPAAPRTLVPGLPRDLETIALTCLRKEPRRRYASAAALADDLLRWRDGFPIRARPVSKLEHARRWCRRRPAFATLLALLAVTLASSLGGLLTLWRHSEAERSRAEHALARAIESDLATSGAVQDLVALLMTTVDRPQMLASDRFVESSRVTRELTAKLRHYRGISTSSLVAICELERQLAEDFRRRGNHAESNNLLLDSLGVLEGRRQGPDRSKVDQAYARALMELGRVAHALERHDLTLSYFQRAQEVLERFVVDDAPGADVIALIDESRRSIADLLDRAGQEEARRRLLESHVRMLDRLSERAECDPAIGLIAALSRVHLRPEDGASEKLRAAIEKFPAKDQLPQALRERVALWIASAVRPYPSGADGIGSKLGRLDPDAYAYGAIRTLESQCEALGVYPAFLPAAVFELGGLAAQRAADERRAGHLDDARRIAAWLTAMGKTLVQRDPADSTFHLVLCSGFEQEAKNAWKIEDYATIEDALRKALAEAVTAFRLDPTNADVRYRVAGLQDKLVGLISEHRSAR